MLDNDEAFDAGIKALSKVPPHLLQSDMMLKKLKEAGIIRKTLEKLADQACTEDFAQDGTKFLNNVSKGQDPEKLGFTLHDVPIIQSVLHRPSNISAQHSEALNLLHSRRKYFTANYSGV